MSPTEEGAGEYNAFVEVVDLQGVDVVELIATRHSLGQPDTTTMELEGGHQWVEQTLFMRFQLRTSATRGADDKPEPVADLGVTLILRFSAPGKPPSEAVLSRFGETTATLVAQPYLRESLHTLASRLGLEGVVLPLVKLPGSAPTEDGED